jgi:hypothetical protein
MPDREVLKGGALLDGEAAATGIDPRPSGPEIVRRAPA